MIATHECTDICSHGDFRSTPDAVEDLGRGEYVVLGCCKQAYGKADGNGLRKRARRHAARAGTCGRAHPYEGARSKCAVRKRPGLDPPLHCEVLVTENLSLIARLSSDTQLEHRAADGELERLVAEPSAFAYRAWLARQLGFHTPLEAALEATPRLAGIIGIRPRSKVARLRQDLATLGVEPAVSSKLPACAAVPASFGSIPTALGWMYVAERWTLQFHNAYRRLATSLPGEMAFASSYLKCYEGNAGVMWRAFVIAVDASCRGDKETAELVAGAHDAFRAVRDYSPIALASVAASSGPAARATRG